MTTLDEPHEYFENNRFHGECAFCPFGPEAVIHHGGEQPAPVVVPGAYSGGTLRPATAAGDLHDPELAQLRTQVTNLQAESTRRVLERRDLRAFVELIRDAGGRAMEGGLVCTGSWCAEQARALLDRLNRGDR